MSASHLEPLLQAAERHAVLAVLRSHPEWTLEHLVRLLGDGSVRAPLLRTLTVGELLDSEPRVVELASDGGPPVDRTRLALAETRSGADFDDLVREVITEAGGRRVGASYLRARLGGPRWKLQNALRRLCDAGLVERCGVTSSTRYGVALADPFAQSGTRD